jgi:PAS domain S-box-containing protein
MVMFSSWQKVGHRDARSGRFPFLAHGGAMGGLIAGFDWSRTSLGPIEGWQAGFCAHVSTMLSAPDPLMILAGPEGELLYNDSCIPFVAARYPAALGAPVRQVWPEAAETVSLIFFAAHGGESRPVSIELHGTQGLPKLVLLCTPLMNEVGKAIGVLARITEKIPAGPQGHGGGRQLSALRDVAETMPGQVWTAKPDGRVNWMNGRLLACLGTGRAAEEGWAWLVHPADRAAIARRWAEAVAAGELYEAECRLRTASGQYLWHLIHATPIRGRSGAIEGWVGSNVNIHIRKLAEAEASRARDRIWSLSRVYMLIFDRQGMIRQSNPAVELGTGWEEAELEGKSLLALIHPEDVDAALMALARVAVGETVQGFECRCRMRNGGYRVIDWEVVPDGELNHAVGRDITEQRTALRALERTWELSPVLKFVLKADGEIVTVNPAWTKALGWSEQESRGRGITGFTAPADFECMQTRLDDPSPAALATEFTVTMLTKQGGRREIAWTKVADGGLFYGFGRDVTAERQAAAAAASASAERERIWVSANDLLATVALDGRLRSVNPAWTRLFGYPDEELLRMGLMDMVVPEDKPVVAQAIQELAQGRPVRDVECRMNDDQERACLISWSADPLGESFYFVGRDVSAQRDAEEQLRQAQKMEAVGQLTGGIAHDFNNLLQGISGSLELVSKHLRRGDTQGLERFIAVAMGAADRAAALTHRLLAFSRRQPLDPKPVAANPLVLAMEVLLRRTLGERVELCLALQDGLWLTLCDPNQLENAVLNLAINARDAMPEGGRLTIETANTEIDGAGGPRRGEIDPGSYVCISVTDTGVGMDAATIAKAFEPFFTTKPLGQGTGLGLSMIYGFARQSNGHVKIQSNPGWGTTVRLYLPRCEGEAACASPTPYEAEAPAAPNGETVLVVEDEPTVRALIVEVLGTLGYAALEAVDGPGGLEILQSRRKIDLLITDIGLPGLNGRQIADAARLLRPKLKILFMTGYAENAVMSVEGLEPGMEMMTKPFAMDALAAKVRGIIGARP